LRKLTKGRKPQSLIYVTKSLFKQPCNTTVAASVKKAIRTTFYCVCSLFEDNSYLSVASPCKSGAFIAVDPRLILW